MKCCVVDCGVEATRTILSSRYCDTCAAVVLLQGRKAATTPYIGFRGQYHDEWRCPCGGHLHEPRGGIQSCDAMGYDGKHERHYWKRDGETWTQVYAAVKE